VKRMTLQRTSIPTNGLMPDGPTESGRHLRIGNDEDSREVFIILKYDKVKIPVRYAPDPIFLGESNPVIPRRWR